MLDNQLYALKERAPLLPAQDELVERIARSTPGDGLHDTAWPGLQFYRASAPTEPLPAVYQPSLCVVAQGSKLARLGEEVLAYDPLNYLIVSMTLPVCGQIVEASAERPYLSLRLDLDPNAVAQLILDTGAQPAPAADAAGDCRGVYAARMAHELLDAVLRLLRLLDAPGDLPVLAPLALREIQYRVLVGELGHQLHALLAGDSHARRIARTVDWLKTHYTQSLRVDALAAMAHMSASAFHHHFRAVTAMSPLQFQKQLRLHEARRLMLSEGLEANAAAHRVGYESASQFSREYRRLFGAPPRREIATVRVTAI